jgi:TPP-dependent pyruvate/acetoin dehydrogenase alpha subunit
MIPSESRQRIETQVEEEIRTAFECAETDVFPEARELLTDVSGD